MAFPPLLLAQAKAQEVTPFQKDIYYGHKGDVLKYDSYVVPPDRAEKLFELANEAGILERRYNLELDTEKQINKINTDFLTQSYEAKLAARNADIADLKKALNKKDRFYEKREFGFIVGVAVTVLSFFLASSAIKSAR